MLTKHLKTVKDQIKYFDHKLKKAPTDSFTQATYWPLKYKFEQLLDYLTNQSQSNSSNIIKNESACNNQSSIYNNITKKPTTPRKETLELDNQILNLIQNHENGIHIKELFG